MPPVVAICEEAITGSHRIAAWEACEMEPRYVEITEQEYIAACEEMFGEVVTIDRINCYNEFCEVLYEIVSDESVKAALKDQRGY